MRKLVFLFALVAAVAASVNSAGIAAEVALDMDLMQNIEDLNKSLSSNIAIKDAPASTTDAKELNRLFTIVEQHFVKKGDAQNAVELSTKSKDLTSEIIKHVAVKNFDAATDASTTLSRTCRSCHTFYKKE
jgi:hypothetical protein